MTTTLAERRMPPKVTPSRIVVQKSAMSLGRAPQIIARSGSAARPTSAATTTGVSPPSSLRGGAVGLARKTCAVLFSRSKTTRTAPSSPSVMRGAEHEEGRRRQEADAPPSSGAAIAIDPQQPDQHEEEAQADRHGRGVELVAAHRRRDAGCARP